MDEQDEHRPLQCARRVPMPNGEMDLCPHPVSDGRLTDVSLGDRRYVGRFCDQHRLEIEKEIEKLMGPPVLEGAARGPRQRRGDAYPDAHNRIWQMSQIRRLLARNRDVIALYTDKKLYKRGRPHKDLLKVFQMLAENEAVDPSRYNYDLPDDWPKGEPKGEDV
jgi:hypothetical protein